ncbi:hypothetical protein [Ruegeria arenilitoris]|uniref:hypothetical protein n=1 Tax=Ruegeria arenilitoris TaxID=1173585 RepID=UPI0014801AB2|nr:hypothetical protein [Ruegeria arenilitoris]
MRNPIIKIIKGPSATSRGVSDAVTSGLSVAYSSIGAAVDRLPLDSEQLFGVLHFRLYEADRARRRGGWLGGRVYNRLSGQDPDYIPVSGTHLIQVFNVLRIETPEFVGVSGQYLLRVDYGQRAYDRMKADRTTENRD